MSQEKEWMEKVYDLLAEQARTVLDMLERRKTLKPGDELDDLEGELYANIFQLQLDAERAREASDAYTDSLPEEDEVPA